jgi:hypothetical protein
MLWRRAEETSADFVEQHLGTAVLFDTREALQHFAIEEAPETGLILEFGVWKGRSINAFADIMAHRGDTRRIWGFDAFKGLEEHWNGLGYHRVRNHFNRGGRLPDVRANVALVPGWIQDTLPPFLEQHPDPIAFLHIDTDTYKPAKLILSRCKSRLHPGSIILFDDLLAHPGWQLGEYRALVEELDATHYGWIGFSGYCGALRIA